MNENAMNNSAELNKRAANEMAMLEKHKLEKEMIAQAPKKIGENEVRKATEILQKYKSGKAHLEQKIIRNEEYWKLRQWGKFEKTSKEDIPSTAWLFNCIQSRHSDIMDSYPVGNFLARQEDDKAEAEKLSAVVPVIMEQNRYEDTYSDIAWYLLKHGGCVQGIFWDGSVHNGLGDIKIKKIDFLSLFWQPGITDIQDSQNVFNIELVDNNILEQRYPQTVGKLGGKSVNVAKYMYDDTVDTTDKSVVIDWYYHTYYNGKKTLQYVKYVNDIVLYATENETEVPEKTVTDPQTGIPITVKTGESIATRGLYDHALYPFVVTALYPIEGSICGYGLTDIAKDTQLQIDLLNKAIIDNATAGATARYFVRNDGTVNLKEYDDPSKKFVHVEGNIDDTNIRPIDHKGLDGIYFNVLGQKIDEIKYITSNQDVNNGAAPSGITAASGIAALQETAGKNARTTNKTIHRSYRDVCYQVIELIRQFYDVPRTFRIHPDGEQEGYMMFSNQGLKPQTQSTMGMDMGFRLPEFDIEVTSEKANPYKKMEINELALSFYNAGFFNPQMTSQALACLDMMDFTRKEDVIRKISENGTLTEMLLLYQQLALSLAEQISPEVAEQVGAQINQMMGGEGQIPSSMASAPRETGTPSTNEAKHMEKARERARETTEVS
jgi:hypothetical protein